MKKNFLRILTATLLLFALAVMPFALPEAETGEAQDLSPAETVGYLEVPPQEDDPLPEGPALQENAVTFEEDFKTYKGEWAGKGNLRMQLKDNTMTFDYHPVFFFDKSYNYDYDKQSSVIADCVAAYKRWGGKYNIRGRVLTIVVNVDPIITSRKSDANVRFIPDASIFGITLTTLVPGCIIWNPNRCCTVNYRMRDMERLDYYVAQHEFGHVLGLFDAYGYSGHLRHNSFLGISLAFLADFIDRILPEAPVELTPRSSIMRSGSVVTPAEAEMLLYAWSRGKLQLYTKSILTCLGAEVSKAFAK